PKGRVVTPLDDEARWLGQPDDPVSPDVLGVPSAGSRTVPPRRHVEDDTTALLLDDLAGRRGQRPGERHRSPAPRRQEEESPTTTDVPVGRVSAPGVDLAPPDPEVDEAAGASIVDLGSRRAGLRTAAPERSSHPSGSARRPMPGVPGAPGPQEDELPAGEEDQAGGRDDVVDDAPAPSGPPAQGAGPQPAAPAPRTDKPASARRSGRKGRAQVPSWDEIVFGGGRPSSS
ncbi:septation protein SepH, partial [Isoptericola sp. NPDC057559]|uniref:septation protein SepH n=1 Tax=Isoptericola sp. NPDC057559 TaxID=3346168 RepID=UPI0036A6616E